MVAAWQELGLSFGMELDVLLWLVAHLSQIYYALLRSVEARGYLLLSMLHVRSKGLVGVPSFVVLSS